MTFEQMKIFLEAAHFGSFTHAAERLGLTQSAVSVSIKKLEEKHDVALFDRSGRRLLLTEAGQVLLNEAERILRDVELTIRRVESRRPAGLSSLVACTGNAYDFWMPEIAARAGAANPIELDLVRGTVEEVTAWVMRGTADIGVTSAMPSHPQFRQIHVFSDRMILCGSPSRAGQIPDGASWSDLAGYGPIVWEQGDLASAVVAALSAHRIESNRVGYAAPRLSSSASVISALKGGRCIGFAPERAVAGAIASGDLTRIGTFEIALRYWMFALRERDIGPLAALVARAANAVAEGARREDAAAEQA